MLRGHVFYHVEDVSLQQEEKIKKGGREAETRGRARFQQGLSPWFQLFLRLRSILVLLQT